MVLTNFECWAHGGAVVDSNGLPANSHNVNMFNTNMASERLNTVTGASAVSHISSNGYYGFSYVNAAHAPADSSQTNNNNNTAHMNDNNNNNNNNNNNRCMPNANDVNGMPMMMHTSMDVGGTVDGAAAAIVASADNISSIKRCKKRYFISDDNYAKCMLLNGCDGGSGAVVGMDDVAVDSIDVRAAKRCRFDDNDAAQYCNDFFSLPSTQIGTQACLMDTEDAQQEQEQEQLQPKQVDVNMGAANTSINNETTNSTSNIHFFTTQQQQHAEQQSQQQQQLQQQVINAGQTTPSIIVYQQQHNYQGHLHRANRDVSRCLLSHMI